MTALNFSHLILLIGTNPLPDFVIAKYFLMENLHLKKIWFVHSEKRDELHQKGTLEFTENIQRLLQKSPEGREITYEFVALSNVSRAKSIADSLQEKCIAYIEDDSAVHLNYTGGTKVMCTHIYQEMKQTCKGLAMSFSYLNAREFKIMHDDPNVNDSGDLRQTIKLSFSHIIALHGYTRVNRRFRDREKFLPAVNAFSDLISQGTLAEYFDERRNGFPWSLFEHKTKKWLGLATRRNDLDGRALQNYFPNTVFSSILVNLPQNYQLLKTGNLTTSMLKNDACCEYVIGFLAGKWLEDYVHNILQQEFPDTEAEINWEIRKRHWAGISKFELDVILVKGYQIIGVSCTTSKKKGVCKLKGFEIILRTRQIGGDEAKAILVTRLPEIERRDLEQELQLDTGGNDNAIVLGLQDLEQEAFRTKVREFIEE